MKKLAKIIIVIAIFLIGTPSVFAKEVTIPSMSVVEGVDNYNIILNAQGNIRFKKIETGKNSASFELDNVKIKNDAPINYENTKKLENITIQKISKDKIKIYIKGQNADKTNFYTQKTNGEPVMIKEAYDNNFKFDFLYLMLIIGLVSAILHTNKKENEKIATTYYEDNHEAILKNLKQKRMMRINDFQKRENLATNPIQMGENTRVLDLEITKKSA